MNTQSLAIPVEAPMPPEIHWKVRIPIQPDEEYIVLFSLLELQRFKSLPPFLYHTLKIKWQLDRPDGPAAYALRAEMGMKRFYTASAWTSQEAFDRFIHSPTHEKAMERFDGLLRRSRFKTVQVKGIALPKFWIEL